MTDPIVKYSKRFLQKHYRELEDYLENIFNSPSTINRLLTYHSIHYNIDYTYIQIVINDTVVKRVKLPREKQLEFMKIQMWIECGPTLHTPDLICFHKKEE